jgi:hypothetical protein
MRDIKQEIVDKSLSFRDASLKFGKHQSKFFKGKDLNNLGSPEEFAKQMANDKDFEKLKEESTKSAQELFTLLDELDVIEGRGIQR